MSKIRIKRKDKNRVLLTELLPYETPMLFSNDGFYKIAKSEVFLESFERIKSKMGTGGFGIPFNYEVKKDEQDGRLLSIIHPLNQLPFVEFYEKHDSLILHLCSKSSFSLRKPIRVAKYSYSPELVVQEDEHRNIGSEVDPEFWDQETKMLRSYFVYEPLDLIYKFFETKEYQRLEQRFSHQLEFDLSKCFYNIYTHSITWAVKGKDTAKRNRAGVSFENEFDKLMQLANYNETNGIVVGPEVSRIFSEIILQQIDLNVLKKLEGSEFRLKFGIDFDVKRYVDDYFVFANDEKILDAIHKVFRKEIEAYKLYINKSKTNRKKSPFISNIAIGKRSVFELCERLALQFINDGAEDGRRIIRIKALKNKRDVARNFVKDFQGIVKLNGLTFDNLNKEVIRYFKKLLVDVLKEDQIVQERGLLADFFNIILEICFYAYSMGVNSSTTFKIAQIIVLISKYLEGLGDTELKLRLYSKIAKESKFIMGVFEQRLKAVDTNIETLNLLIALRKLGTEFLLGEDKLRELFGAKLKVKGFGLNYFQIVSLLYYIRNDISYQRLKEDIKKQIIQKFTEETFPFSKAELFLLFFDMVCCPFVELEFKRKLIRCSKYENDLTKLDPFITLVEEQEEWFMNWDTDIDLEGVLKSKQWSTTY